MSDKLGSMDTLSLIPPKEIWLLYRGGFPPWVFSADDAPGGETYLAALSKSEALAAAKHQKEMYGIDCIPFRIRTN